MPEKRDVTALLIVRERLEKAGLPRSFSGTDRMSERAVLETFVALIDRIEKLEAAS